MMRPAMIRLRAGTGVVLVLLAMLAGCSSPPSRFYTLSATAASSATPSKLSVAVGPVSVPATVDRPQIVVTTSANQVSIDEYARWASPIQDNLARVIADDLVAILGTPKVTLYPVPLNANVEFRVEVEVRNFESAPGSYAAIDAVWSVRRMKDGKVDTGRTSVRETLAQSGYDELAAAHSRAVARLSDDIAKTIRALDIEVR